MKIEQIKQETDVEVHMDEMPMQVLKEDKRGYIWAVGNNHGVFYQFAMGRSGAYACDMLKNYMGVVLTDGYGGYNRLKKMAKEHPQKPIRLANCWSHVRRKFKEAALSHEAAEHGVELIRELYRVEHEAKDLTEFRSLRDTRSRKIVEKLQEWMDAEQNKHSPDSNLGRAISYTHKLMPGLTAFLDDANIPLDNNLIECALRAPVLGRRNYEGFRTLNGADVAMVYFTPIETCKLLKLNPEKYLKDAAHMATQSETIPDPYEYATNLKYQQPAA